MPAKAPPVGELLAAKLKLLGNRIRHHRKQQRLSAVATAEAAGLSRATLHRIEQGHASVTIGAYLSVSAALGVELDLRGPQSAQTAAPGSSLPSSLRVDDYPELKRLSWHRPGAAEISPADALRLYERNWRHVDQSRLQPAERALLQTLGDELGAGRLLV